MYKEIVDFIRAQFQGKSRIPLHEPFFGGNEKKYLKECLDSTFVSSIGHYVNQFEQKLADYTGARYAVAVVNGTAALHMGLLAAGVKRDEIVITQPLSFIATSNAIAYLGARHLYIDVDLETLGLSPVKLKCYLEQYVMRKDGAAFHRESGKRIAACVPMHPFGHPCHIDELAGICKEYNFTLVEDAAESVGSFYKDKHTGLFGSLGTFSFNGNKIVTCGGGGAIVTDDEKLATHIRHLTTQAKVPHPWEFIHDEIGYNYRMPNINAALACAQLEQLQEFIQCKRELAQRYSDFFGNTPVKFIQEPVGARSNYWLCSILFDNRNERDGFLEFANNNGVMVRPAWRLMNEFSMFRNAYKGDLSDATWIADRLVNIPSSVR